MNQKVEAMTPAERMTAGLCPECGIALAGWSVEHHRDQHYPNAFKRPLQGEALVRYNLMTSYAQAQKG